MKTKLLVITFFAMLSMNAQTTHEILWQIGASGDAANLTIEVGDTVLWIWNDALPHTVTSRPGSNETFDSGSILGLGSEYSHTFVDEGVNEYQCNFHPGSMFGTITVESNLSVFEVDENKGFRLFPNPSSSVLNFEFPITITSGSLKVVDVLGRRVMQKNLNGVNTMTIDIEALASGLYLVEVHQENTSNVKRFIKN